MSCARNPHHSPCTVLAASHFLQRPLCRFVSVSLPVLALTLTLHLGYKLSLVSTFNPQPSFKVKKSWGKQTVAPQLHLDDFFWIVAFLHQKGSLREHWA